MNAVTLHTVRATVDGEAALKLPVRPTATARPNQMARTTGRNVAGRIMTAIGSLRDQGDETSSSLGQVSAPYAFLADRSCDSRQPLRHRRFDVDLCCVQQGDTVVCFTLE